MLNTATTKIQFPERERRSTPPPEAARPEPPVHFHQGPAGEPPVLRRGVHAPAHDRLRAPRGPRARSSYADRSWSSPSTGPRGPASPRSRALSRSGSASRSSTRGRCIAASRSARSSPTSRRPRWPSGRDRGRRARPARRPRRDRRDPDARGLRARVRGLRRSRACARRWCAASRRSWPPATGSPRAATSARSSPRTPRSRSSFRRSRRARQAPRGRAGHRHRPGPAGAARARPARPDRGPHRARARARRVPVDTTALTVDEVVDQIATLVVEAEELR